MIPDSVPLVVSADEAGIHWRTALHRAVNSEQPVFAVLEGVARLTVAESGKNLLALAEKMRADHARLLSAAAPKLGPDPVPWTVSDDQPPDLPPNVTVYDYRLSAPEHRPPSLWRLSAIEHNKLIRRPPPWTVSEIFPPDFVEWMPNAFRFEVPPTEIDERALFLAPRSKKNPAKTGTRRNRNSHPEIPKIFWRAFLALQIMNEDPSYKAVWDIIFDEWKTLKTSLSRPIYDFHEMIVYMYPSYKPDACFEWVTAHKDKGIYRLVSLPPLLSKLKKNPPTL